MLTTKLLMLHKINEDHRRAKVVSKLSTQRLESEEKQGKKEDKLEFKLQKRKTRNKEKRRINSNLI